MARVHFSSKTIKHQFKIWINFNEVKVFLTDIYRKKNSIEVRTDGIEVGIGGNIFSIENNSDQLVTIRIIKFNIFS